MSGSREEYSFCPLPTYAQASGWRVNSFCLQGGSLKPFSFLLSQCSERGPDAEAMHHLVWKSMTALQWRLLAVILPDWMGDGVKWKYLTISVRSKTSQESNPVLCLPLPSCSQIYQLTYMSSYSICNQSLKKDFCLFFGDFFYLLYQKHSYAGCLFLLYSSGCLIIELASAPSYNFIVCTRTMHSSVLPFHTQLRCWQPVYYRLDILQSLSVITQLRNMR